MNIDIMKDLAFNGKSSTFINLLKNKDEQKIINYINTATKLNINLFNTFEDENHLSVVYDLYFNVINLWLKKDKKELLDAIEENGFNAFKIPPITNNMNYSFYHYIMNKKLQPSILKNSNVYIYFFLKHIEKKSLEENIDQDIQNIFIFQNEHLKKRKETILLLRTEDFYNIKAVRENLLFNPILSKNAKTEKVKKELDLFEAMSKDISLDNKVYENIFNHIKTNRNFEKTINILFNNNKQLFVDKVINNHLHEVILDSFGYYVLQLPETIKITNKNDIFSNLIKSISFYNTRDKFFKKLDNMGVRINAQNVADAMINHHFDLTKYFSLNNVEANYLKYKALLSLTKEVSNIEFKDLKNVEQMFESVNFSGFNKQQCAKVLRNLFVQNNNLITRADRDIRAIESPRTMIYHKKLYINNIAKLFINQNANHPDFLEFFNNEKLRNYLFNKLFSEIIIDHRICLKWKDEYMKAIINSQNYSSIFAANKNFLNIFEYKLYENVNEQQFKEVIVPAYAKLMYIKLIKNSMGSEEISDKVNETFLNYIIDNYNKNIKHLLCFINIEYKHKPELAIEIEKLLIQTSLPYKNVVISENKKKRL